MFIPLPLPIGAGTMASTNYAEDFSAVVQRDLFWRSISPRKVLSRGRVDIKELYRAMKIYPAIDLINGKLSACQQEILIE